MSLLGLGGVGFAATIVTLKTGVPQPVGPYEITVDSVGEQGPRTTRTPSPV